MPLRIKNWNKFQHFKDRKPPWVKLYRDLLDDIKWHELDAEAAKVLVMLWLIASESDGILPDSKELAFRLRMATKSVNSCVSKISHWLEHDDINVISDINEISTVYQDDDLERETETETEEEEEPKEVTGLDPVAWKHWLEYRTSIHKPIKPVSIPAAQRKLAGFGSDQADVVEQSVANGWTGMFELKTGDGHGKNGISRGFGSSVANTIRELTGQNRQGSRTLDGDATRLD